MLENDEICEYEYLNNEEANARDEILKKIYAGEKNKNELLFFDLDIYLNGKTMYENLIKSMNKSIFEPDFRLSSSQIELLDIIEQNNIFISAPTSFGKTFIVLEYISRNTHSLNNIVFIIPTLALMNELLKKIYNKFSSEYNICINSNEVFREKNIFIFVPERSDYEFVKKITELGLDLVIIDEIYKLKPKDGRELGTDDRILVMNKVYLNMIQIAKKIILLGPFIKSISFENTKLEIVRYYSNLNPVYNYVHKMSGLNWQDYIGDEKELVFFYKPESIYAAIPSIISKIPESVEFIEKYSDEIEYLKNNISEKWYVISLLKRGIGIHHGKIPMYLRKFYEDEFNAGNIKCLLCTSTLMEGVNTPTMKLLVVEDPGTVFKLNNLIGRVGRLNVNNPTPGRILLFDNKSCERYDDRNSWTDLQILAEEPIGTTADEMLFLGKDIKSKKKKEDAMKKIELIVDTSGKSIDEIKKYDIRVNKAVNFVCKGYEKKFINSINLYECVVYANEIIGKQSHDFQLNSFNNLNYPNSTLPYVVFMEKMLIKKTINEIIKEFEMQYGNLSSENLNLMIDKLLKLRSHIKFRLIKIINYLNLFNVNISCNSNLKKFNNLLLDFEQNNIINKIFDDLGIEESDFEQLTKFISNNADISTSNIIFQIKNKKDDILKSKLSPFTKRNISKL